MVLSANQEIAEKGGNKEGKDAIPKVTQKFISRQHCHTKHTHPITLGHLNYHSTVHTIERPKDRMKNKYLSIHIIK